MKIIPGVVSATFRQMAAEELIELCVQAGLKAVEWSENAHVLPDDSKGAAFLGARTEAAGLKVAAYGSYYRLGEQKDGGERFLKSLISAKAMKAPVIRVWAGTKPSCDVNDAEFISMAEEAAMIGRMADKERIRVAFEWHKNTLTDTNVSGMRLLRQANQDNLCCLWQPTVDLTMKERMEGIELLGERLENLHVYYWRNGIKRPLAEGREEWLYYLEGVDHRRERYALLEFVRDNTRQQFLEDAKTLHEILIQSGRA